LIPITEAPTHLIPKDPRATAVCLTVKVKLGDFYDVGTKRTETSWMGTVITYRKEWGWKAVEVGP